MPNLTYTLLSCFNAEPAMPIPVNGNSGKNYGTAVWDQSKGAHVLRGVPKEQWEGEMSRDVTENRHIVYGKWRVFAESEEQSDQTEVATKEALPPEETAEARESRILASRWKTLTVDAKALGIDPNGKSTLTLQKEILEAYKAKDTKLE